MRCLIVQHIHEAGVACLRDSGITPVLCPSPDMETVIGMIGPCEAVITRNAGLSAGAFEAAERLRVVVVHGAGHDPVDKAAAARKGVTICNTPGTNARSVAELALGLAIAVARGVVDADRAERQGTVGFRESRRFAELAGRTALIVGWGAVGRTLGGLLDGLGMDVRVHSLRAPETGSFRRVASLHDGLAAADLVSLHTPLRDGTRHMLDAPAFAATKPGAILVNTARAGLVDEAALCGALGSGRLAGAALDVYSAEAPRGPLGTLPNVIFSPHLGGTTEEALRRTALAAAGHVVSALEGRLPPTVVNLPDLTSHRRTGA